MKGCRPLTSQEVEAVLANLSGRFANRDKALFLLGVKSGFRISELLSLRVGDVLQGGQLANRVHVERRSTKGKVEGRAVILNSCAKRALAGWLAELDVTNGCEPTTFVFRSRKGANQPISRVQAYRVLKRAFDSAGLTGKLGTHSMRKTFAARMYELLDGDLVKTQHALGHRNVNSTVSYLSFNQEDIDDAILAL